MRLDEIAPCHRKDVGRSGFLAESTLSPRQTNHLLDRSHRLNTVWIVLWMNDSDYIHGSLGICRGGTRCQARAIEGC